MVEVHLDRCILDLNGTVIAFGPLWLKIFVAIQSLKFHNVFYNIVSTITLFSQLTKTIPRSFGLYYIYLLYITFKIRGSKVQLLPEVFSLLQTPPHRIWSPSILLLNDYWFPFLVVNRSGREFHHSLPSSADVKNEWSCTSASPVRLHRVDRDRFT